MATVLPASQQRIDGGGGVVGHVVDDDVGILHALKLGGAGSQIRPEPALIVDGSSGQDGHDGLVGSGLSHDDAVIAPGVAALGEALGVQARTTR